MYLLAGARLLMRRWLTCLAGLVATIAACIYVSGAVAIDHQATSQMLLILPPAASGAEHPTNPYLNLPEGLTTTAGLVAGNLSTKDTQRGLAAAGDDAEYTIVVLQGAGPLIAITATAPDPDVALATRDTLMDMVDQQLTAMQDEAQVPLDQVMRATRSSVSQDAEPMPTARYRAIGATAVAGLVLVGLLALLVDWLLLRRHTRRAAPADRRRRLLVTDATPPTPEDLHAVDPEEHADPGGTADADEEATRQVAAEPQADVPVEAPPEVQEVKPASSPDEAGERSAVRIDIPRPQRNRSPNRGRLPKQRGGPRTPVAIAEPTMEGVPGPPPGQRLAERVTPG